MVSRLKDVRLRVKAAIELVPSSVTLYSKPTYDKATQGSTEDPAPLVVSNASVPYDFSTGFSGLGLASRPTASVEVGDMGIVFPYDVAKVPEEGGTVMIGTVKWPIVGVEKPLEDETTIICYICQLRR